MPLDARGAGRCASRVLSTLLVSLLVACAGPGGAAKDGPMSFEEFLAADKNQDGKLDPDEATAALPALGRQFRRVDTDRSGYLSWAEVKALRFGLRRESPPPE
jgi:hypothetical protein